MVWMPIAKDMYGYDAHITTDGEYGYGLPILYTQLFGYCFLLLLTFQTQ